MLFSPAYGITCHKSQGSTFNYDYTIHEFSSFDDRMKYVALSRATNIKHIIIVEKLVRNVSEQLLKAESETFQSRILEADCATLRSSF